MLDLIVPQHKESSPISSQKRTVIIDNIKNNFKAKLEPVLTKINSESQKHPKQAQDKDHL